MRNGMRRRIENSEETNEITEGSGNVFADLGLPNAEELLAKAPLVQRIDDLIQERGLTVKQAAAALRVRPTRLTALLRGNLEQFSFAQLLRFLNHFGQEIEIVFKPLKRTRGRNMTKMVAR